VIGQDMNDLLFLLTGGDLRSDGRANEVADEVLANPNLFPLLFEGLDETDDVVRGRTSHALEFVSRTRPELLTSHLPQLLDLARKDDVAMVRWHLAMIFANLSIFEEIIDQTLSVLYDLLDDPAVFVKSWAISSLCIIGKHYPHLRGEIISWIIPLREDYSIAIRTRVAKALTALENEEEPIPPGWVKSKLL